MSKPTGTQSSSISSRWLARHQRGHNFVAVWVYREAGVLEYEAPHRRVLSALGLIVSSKNIGSFQIYSDEGTAALPICFFQRNECVCVLNYQLDDDDKGWFCDQLKNAKRLSGCWHQNHQHQWIPWRMLQTLWWSPVLFQQQIRKTMNRTNWRRHLRTVQPWKNWPAVNETMLHGQHAGREGLQQAISAQCWDIFGPRYPEARSHW